MTEHLDHSSNLAVFKPAKVRGRRLNKFLLKIPLIQKSIGAQLGLFPCQSFFGINFINFKWFVVVEDDLTNALATQLRNVDSKMGFRTMLMYTSEFILGLRGMKRILMTSR